MVVRWLPSSSCWQLYILYYLLVVFRWLPSSSCWQLYTLYYLLVVVRRLLSSSCWQSYTLCYLLGVVRRLLSSSCWQIYAFSYLRVVAKLTVLTSIHKSFYLQCIFHIFWDFIWGIITSFHNKSFNNLFDMIGNLFAIFAIKSPYISMPYIILECMYKLYIIILLIY